MEYVTSVQQHALNVHQITFVFLVLKSITIIMEVVKNVLNDVKAAQNLQNVYLVLMGFMEHFVLHSVVRIVKTMFVT